MKNLLVLLFFISFLTTIAQEGADKYSTVVPPSPTASSLGKYGLVPIGMHTGTAQYTIPIYELKSNKLTVPIALNYSTNGVKVDQIASWVGMDWSLIAGGIITRTVKGKADEKSTRVSFEDQETSTDLPINVIEDLIASHIDIDRIDTEPDIFTFNFNGQSGKFLIDNDGFPRHIPYYSDIQIEILSTGFTSFIITTSDGIKYYFGEESSSREYAFVHNSCSDRNILDRYTTAWHLNRIEHPSGDMINFKYAEGGDLNFNYDTGISQSFSRKVNALQGECISATGLLTCVNSLTVTTVLLEEINTENVSVKFNSSHRIGFDDYKLDSIIITSHEDIFKKHQFDFSYIYSNNTSHTNDWSDSTTRRLFLESVVESGTSINSPKKYSFEYNNIDGLPVRLSFSQDHWGYYNGANNGNLFIPEPPGYDEYFNYGIANREPNASVSGYGTLSKINYPTGGYSMIEFEPHEYWGQQISYTEGHTELYETVFNHTQIEPNTVTRSISLPPQNELILFIELSCKDGYTCNEEEAEGNITIRKTSGGTIASMAIFNEYSDNNLPISKLQAITGVSAGDYEIDLSVDNYRYEIKLRFIYYDIPPVAISEYKNIESSGLRVKRITSKQDEFSNAVVNRYYYSKYQSFEIGSGQILNNPNYVTQSLNANYNEFGILVNCKYYNFSSNSTNLLYSMEGYHIGYSEVTKGFGENFENGGENFSYSVKRNRETRIKRGNLSLSGNLITSSGWGPADLIGKRIFKKTTLGDFVTLKNDTYEYTPSIYNTEIRNRDVVTGAHIRKEFFGPETTQGYMDCDATNINDRVFSHYRCTTDHKHFWSWTNAGETWRCTQILGGPPNNEKIYVGLPCYGKNENSSIYHFINPYEYEIIAYDLTTDWHYLKKETSRRFDENGENRITIVKEYEYDNPLHAQLTKVTTADSDGNVYVQKSYYPLDYDYANIPELGPLIQNGQIGLPIDIRSEVNGKLSSGQLFMYNNKGQIIEVHLSEEEKGSSLLFQPLNPYSYGETKLKITYDPVTGNMDEVTKEHGLKTVYLWGYGNQFPIAKIENSDRAMVSNAITGVLSSLPVSHTSMDELLSNLNSIQTNSSQQGEWRDFNHSLRNALPNSMVSTFTYDPLFGITSATDSKGHTIYYSYDSLNRLKEVRDTEGNLVTDYEYHYKN